MNKRQRVDFVSAMQGIEDREGIRRRPAPVPASGGGPTVNTARAQPVQASRVGKVSIGVWVDPAVRKQLAQIGLDHDKEHAELMVEALNLMFERYGRPPIARR